jgi:hydrogenase maturation protein HypF
VHGAAGSTPQTASQALRLLVMGRVQAVGFRPFVYRLAHHHQLSGWVRNRTGAVEINVSGSTAALAAFEHALIHAAPPLAAPVIESRTDVTDRASDAAPIGFEILPSALSDKPRICVPPDFFMCQDCQRELHDPLNRRCHYPFINCTQCGPRYTLIRGMPYDRKKTAMAAFTLCDACAREYSDPLDRRFHAEPVACPDCGPSLEFVTTGPGRSATKPLAATVQALREGAIVAVKGIGGYHLMCDAASDKALAALRTRKHRPTKPLAVMFPATGRDGLDQVRLCARLNANTAAAIRGAGRPIVLVPLRADAPLAAGISPGLNEVGAFLPYSPLHQLLLDEFGSPLVATSGNLSGEPVLTDNAEASTRLATIADAFLHHDRPIERPADDPVLRPVANRIRPLRIGRGCAPMELKLRRPLPQPILAVGGHLKNTVALAWEDRVVVSPHIGDMDTPRSQQVFAQVADDLQQLYGVRAEALICDRHPGYASSRWASEQRLPVMPVWHHHAHASALAGEHRDIGNWLMFTWDGVGLGEDGTLWGGETFHGLPGAWRRVASLKKFQLPGGDRAGREPWRSAAALCWATNSAWQPALDTEKLTKRAWQQSINCHDTSAAGRLFDAAACLLLDVHETSYEGEGPMQLEAAAVGDGPVVALPLESADDMLRIDWQPLLPMLLDQQLTTAERASGFHLSLAQAIARLGVTLRGSHSIDRVGLTGGVFQNARLAAATVAALAAQDLDAVLPTALPCNDAGLSFGQVIEYLARS